MGLTGEDELEVLVSSQHFSYGMVIQTGGEESLSAPACETFTTIGRLLSTIWADKRGLRPSVVFTPADHSDYGQPVVCLSLFCTEKEVERYTIQCFDEKSFKTLHLRLPRALGIEPAQT